MADIIRLMIDLIVSEIEPRDNFTFPEKLDDKALNMLYSLSCNHDMCHLVASALEKRNLINSKSELGRKFEKEKLKSVYRNMLSNNGLEESCSVLEDAEIDYLPLKGAVIRSLYPEEWMRISRDTDILIHRNDLDRAVEIFKNKGYDDRGRDFHDHHLVSPQKCHLELHFSIEEKQEKADAVLNKVWENSYLKESFRWAMSNEFFMFYAIAHAAFHFVAGGCGIRSLIDLHLMEKKLCFDQSKLEQFLTDAELNDFYRGIQALNRVWFEGEKHSPVTAKTEKYIITGGAFGTKSNISVAGQIKQGGKVKYFVSRIFMPKRELQIKYPKLKKYPILLPYYEVCRWFGLLSKNGLSNAKGELGSSQEEDYSEMFTELGLK